MVRGPGILESFAATLRQDPVGNQTRVTYRYNFETRPRFLRPILNIGCSIFFASEVRNRLQRLKQFLESGRQKLTRSPFTCTMVLKTCRRRKSYLRCERREERSARSVVGSIGGI
jgi:hypothetical protein